nr:hypothetical protein [Tanacetum cinerariifolium]
RDNHLDPHPDPHHHHLLDPHPDQNQECILVNQQWVRQQLAVDAPQLERHHPPVVYSLGTPVLVYKVCKRVRVVPALALWGQAHSPVGVGPETQLQHMHLVMYHEESAMGEIAASSGCSLTGSTSSSGGMNSGYASFETYGR